MPSLAHRVLTASNRLLRPLGAQITRTQTDERQRAQRREAQAIIDRHDAQSMTDVQTLAERYAAPVLGQVDTWELLEMLGQCVDPTDQRLGAASQLIHVLQVLDMMIDEGVTDEELLLVALFHDLGKVLLLTNEDPANVVCLNHAITGEPGGGLSQLTTQWNHDEFAATRLEGILPATSVQLVRFHSVLPHELAPYLATTDQEFAHELHQPFSHFDHASKSSFLRPKVQLGDFKELVRRRMPSRLEI